MDDVYDTQNVNKSFAIELKVEFLLDIKFFFIVRNSFYLICSVQNEKANCNVWTHALAKLFHVYKLHFCTLINLMDTHVVHGNLISAVKKHTLELKNVGFVHFLVWFEVHFRRTNYCP